MNERSQKPVYRVWLVDLTRRWVIKPKAVKRSFSLHARHQSQALRNSTCLFISSTESGGDELQQTARLLANRIALLPSQDDARVGLAARQILPVNSVKIPDIECVQNTPLVCSQFEVPFVRPSNHVSFQRRQHITATGTQRMDKIPIHCVFVNI